METTKKNQEEKAKDELLNKREVLSEEELMEVAGGGVSKEAYDECVKICDVRPSCLSAKKECYRLCRIRGKIQA